MNDILPPRRPQPPISASSPQSPAPPAPPSSAFSAIPSPEPTPVIQEEKPKKPRKKWLWWGLAVILLLGILAVGSVVWYEMQLRPVAPADTSRVRVTIDSGSTPSQIGQTLLEKKLIRNVTAFDIYTKLTHTRSKLQAGTYSLSPSQSVSAIVEHLASGNVDQFSLTFLPGATLAEDRAALIKAGYSADNVDAALGKTYTHPLFQGKPASADLEGYIYGETYNFDSSATVEQILTKTFDEYYSVIQQGNLVEGFKKQNLNLYQGITLASIIQREVPKADDQRQVAQIFYKRLALNMPLGSDVTYQYAAKKMGVSPTPDLDSPYNTRKVTGLPPGPIAMPGKTALEAVANPAPGDYLYFLSGDDDVTYYARTDAEHEANIHNHCQVKCSIL